MNVNKIQRLGEQHKALKKFHAECNKDGVELSANDTKTGLAPADLDFDTTQLIISDVRVSILKRISEIENKIRKEVANG